VAARNATLRTANALFIERTPIHRASLPYSAFRHYIKLDIAVV
jgi:hypothetical protein